MKPLSSPQLAAIASQYATQVTMLVRINWGEGTYTTYSDKTYTDAQAKILELGNIESFLSVDNLQTFTVPVSLDDTDGSIKAILETVDVHKKPVEILMAVDDQLFTLFIGEITTPFSWGEGDKQINFNISTAIESNEVGFSPEEGQLDFVSDEYEGVPWPLCFGNVVRVPAVKIRTRAVAKLAEPLSYPDPMLKYKLQRIEAAYMQEKFMFQFWQLVMQGSRDLVPQPAWWILKEYIKVVIMEDQTQALLLTQMGLYATKRKEIEKGPRNFVLRDELIVLEQSITVLAAKSQAIYTRKKWLEERIEMTKFAYQQEKTAANEMLASYNRQREILAAYVEVQFEVCEQERNRKTVVKVFNADNFPDGEEVDVEINRVRWRVKFSHTDNTMEIVAGPIDLYTNVPVGTWQEDDEPCAEYNPIADLSLLWLADDPPQDLTGTYLLVKKRETDDASNPEPVRHILKVEKQVGRKVYYTLVSLGYDGSGGGRGTTLDTIINELVQPPGGWRDLPGPGGLIPNEWYSGNLDPNIWLRPESFMYLKIINSLPYPPSQEEARAIATLVYHLERDVVSGIDIVPPTPRDVFTIVGEDVEEILAANGIAKEQWFDDFEIIDEEIPENFYWEAAAGSEIVEHGTGCDLYMVNLLPSTIKAVEAYRTLEDGTRILAPVPSSYYTKNENYDLGAYNVTYLSFKTALRSIAGEGWEDTVYVTLDSSVGPNVVDIIQWILETYTDRTCNAGNFATVKTKVANYPANFALLERPDAIDEVRRICWEARLAIYFSNGEYYLKYLSEEPDSDRTLTEDDIETQSLKLSYTQTEELMTRIIATYNESYLPLEEGQRQPRILMRYNVSRYGLSTREEFFHIYNIRELVEKSATFWLIRLSSIWKMVTLKTIIKNIDVDTLDTLSLDLQRPHVATVVPKCVVEQASFDPSENCVTLTLHTGIKTGTSVPYAFFWPSSVDASEEWPEADADVSDGPGSDVVGTIGCD